MYMLRELERGDLPEVNRWRRDPAVIGRLTAPYRFINEEVDERWLDAYMQNRAHAIRCAVVDEELSDRILGLVSLTNIAWVHRTAYFGIMIGRASFGHPWIFREVKHYLATGELLPPMSVRERVDLARLHLAKSLELKDERRGIFEMRRHLSCYFKGLDNFKETRLKLVTSTDPAELFATLDHIAEVWG